MDAVVVRHEVRGGHRRAEGAAVGVPVVRVPPEQRVLLADRVVHTAAHRVRIVRGVGQRTEPLHRPEIGLDYVHALLVGALVVGEEMRLVLLERPAQDEPRLLARELGIVGQRAAHQPGVGRQALVAVVEVRRAAEIVRARTRDDIDGAERRDAGGEIEVRRRDLELLDDFLREVLPGAAFNRVADVAAVHRDRRPRGRPAEHRDVELGVELRRVAEVHRHARLQRREVHETAPVQRQALDLRAGDDALHPIRGRDRPPSRCR